MGKLGFSNRRNGITLSPQFSFDNYTAEILAEELAKQLKLASASISFMNETDSYAIFIKKRSDKDVNGFIDIVVHGNEVSVQLSSNKLILNHRQFAKLLNKQFNVKKIKGVRLLSCNTGALENGFAQKLANKLHKPVIAPTKYEFCFLNGIHNVYGSKDKGKTPDFNDKGEYKTFYPRRIEK